MMLNIGDAYTISACIAPKSANKNTSETGSAIITENSNQFLFICYMGAGDAGINWKVQESADGTTYTDVSGKTASHSATDDNTIKTIEVLGSELSATTKYIRLVATLVNEGTASLLAGCVVVENTRYI